MCYLSVKKHWSACLTALLIGFDASAAWAEICFLPSGTCVDSTMAEVECDSSYSLSARKSGDHWKCDRCGGKFYCYCDSNFTEKNGKCVYDESHDKCPNGEYTLTADLGDGYACKKCDDKSSAQYGKYKCDEAEEKCKESGYTYAKTDNNTCAGGDNKCPDGDFYKVCTCNGYDKEAEEDKCYNYESCELGDGKTTYYKTGTSKKTCTNSEYVTADSETFKNDDNECTFACEEACEDNKKYYICSPKTKCDASKGEYKTRLECEAAYRRTTRLTGMNGADYYEGCPCPTDGPGSGKKYGYDANGTELHYYLSPCCSPDIEEEEDVIYDGVVRGVQCTQRLYKDDPDKVCWVADLINSCDDAGAKFTASCRTSGAGKIVCRLTVSGAINPNKYNLRVWYHDSGTYQDNTYDIKPNLSSSQQITVRVGSENPPAGVSRCEIIDLQNDENALATIDRPTCDFTGTLNSRCEFGQSTEGNNSTIVNARIRSIWVARYRCSDTDAIAAAERGEAPYLMHKVNGSGETKYYPSNSWTNLSFDRTQESYDYAREAITDQYGPEGYRLKCNSFLALKSDCIAAGVCDSNGNYNTSYTYNVACGSIGIRQTVGITTSDDYVLVELCYPSSCSNSRGGCNRTGGSGGGSGGNGGNNTISNNVNNFDDVVEPY